MDGRAKTGRSGSEPASPTPRRCAASSQRRFRRSRRRRERSARPDSQPRDGGRESRDGLARRRCAPAAPSWSEPTSSSQACAACVALTLDRASSLGVEAECPRAGRADRLRARGAERPAADVHEGRAAQRHGDRGVLARRRGGSRPWRAEGLVRVVLALSWRLVTAPLYYAAWPSPSASPKPRARSTTCEERPPTVVTHLRGSGGATCSRAVPDMNPCDDQLQGSCSA